jgi:hypothetical protein
MTAMAAARGRSRSDHILRTAARGAGLIGLAVVIGIVLLQVVDNGSSGGGGVTPPSAATGGGGTTSTTKGSIGRQPQEINVFVQNGSGLAGAAATKSNELRGLGYKIAGTGNAPEQTGNTVACASGYDKEATQLSQVITGTVSTFPTSPPAGAEAANCIVTVGKA